MREQHFELSQFRAVASFTDRTQIRQALSFWAANHGPRDSFHLPLPFSPSGGDSMTARFVDETFQLEFRNNGVARTRLGFLESLELLEDEPSQARPTRAYLIKAWWEGSATINYWTDAPCDVVVGGITYLRKRLEVKSTTDSITDLSTTEWEFILFDYEGNPLRAFRRLQLERRLRVEISECELENPTNVEQIFTGTIKTSTNVGPLYSAKCALLGGVLKNLTPNHYCMQSCNDSIYGELCGVNPEDFRVDGALSSTSGVEVVVTTGDASAADWFTNGYAEFGDGDTMEIRWIMSSTPVAGGQKLQISRPLWFSTAGVGVKMYPGCDLQYEGGCAKFNNQPQFEGDPYKPDYLRSVNSGFKATTGK